MLGDLKERLAQRDISIELSEKAKEFLAKAGFDPVYGARPLKRAIYEYVEDRIADMILSDQIKEGDTILIDSNGEDIILNVK